MNAFFNDSIIRKEYHTVHIFNSHSNYLVPGHKKDSN